MANKKTGRRNNTQKKQKQKRAQKLGGQRMSLAASSAFPATTWRVLNYADVVTLTEAAAGIGAYQLYRANDLYDPDYSGVGHQPLYFDQLCASTGPYLNFMVPSADFDLRFHNTSGYPVQLIVTLTNYSTIPASRSLAMERPFAWKHLLATNTTGGACIQKTIHSDNAGLAGISKTQYEADYWGTYAQSAPASVTATPLFLSVIIYGIGGIASVVVSVNIRYKSKFFGLGAMPAS